MSIKSTCTRVYVYDVLIYKLQTIINKKIQVAKSRGMLKVLVPGE